MPRPPQEDKVVCPSCGFANYPTANFCLECGAPVSAHAVNDAFDTIKSQGWAYRKSQETPKLIVVIGNWLIFSPPAIMGAIGSYTWLTEVVFERHQGGAINRLLVYVVFPLLCGGVLYISTTIIYRTTRTYLNAQQQKGEPSIDEDEDFDDDDVEDGGEFDDDVDEEDDDEDGEDYKRRR